MHRSISRPPSKPKHPRGKSTTVQCRGGRLRYQGKPCARLLTVHRAVARSGILVVAAHHPLLVALPVAVLDGVAFVVRLFAARSEEHTSELQSLMRISYAVFCLKKKNT